MSTPNKPPGKRTIQATVGAACAAALITCVPKFEGTVLRGYKDPIGIVTACTGHAATAVLGRPYTPQQCADFLNDDLVAHADGIAACVKAPLTYYQRAAFISFAFNVGDAKFCGSTMARLANAGAFPAACAQLSRWVYAGQPPKALPGLVTRRAYERQLCEGKMQ
jgi:lysozyme